jgi:hypothetical protein
LFIEKDTNVIKGLLHELIESIKKLLEEPSKKNNTFRDLFSGFYE